MADIDKVFSGSIAQLYEKHLVPLIFEPYAADVGERLRARQLSRVLEIAAGTGVVTRALARELPHGTAIVATDLNQAMLDHAAASVEAYALAEHHTKNAIALGRLKTEFKDTVEVTQLPASVLRDLKKLAAEVIREESEKTPTAKKVHASFTKFQALVGPWDHVAEGAYHQLVAG